MRLPTSQSHHNAPSEKPGHRHAARAQFDKSAAITAFVRPFHVHSRLRACIALHVLRKCAPGGPSRVTEPVCSRKRRQSCSKVDSDNAHDPPDDPASTPSVKNVPSTSGLGQTWGNPSRRGTRRDTSRKRGEPKPADPGAPAAYTLCESKAWRSSHARGNQKLVCFQK